MNRILAAGALTGAMVFSLPVSADAGNGVLNFSGSIVSTPCNLSMEEANQTVEMGQQSTTAIQASGASPEIPFSITLTDCSATPAQISWTGPQGDRQDDLLTSTPDLLLRIIDNPSAGWHYDFDGTPHPLPNDLTEGTNEIKFIAFLASYDWPAVAEGTYTASANFTMHYD